MLRDSKPEKGKVKSPPSKTEDGARKAILRFIVRATRSKLEAIVLS